MGYDEFSKKCQELKELADVYRSEGLVEDETRNAFINPLLRELGYDVSDLRVVRVQYLAGFAGATQEEVDYAIMDGEAKPMILVEAKRLNVELDIRNASQLSNYFNNTDARAGILTNGIIYEVYLDKVRENVMDGEPFFRLDLRRDDEGARRAFYNLSRSEDGSFDQAGFEQAVEDWRITTEDKPRVMGVFRQWYEGSADDLGKLLTQQLTMQGTVAVDRLINSLASEWFKEFVDSYAQSHPTLHQPQLPPVPQPQHQQAAQSQTPTPDTEWKPLMEWPRITETQDLPNEIMFPDGTTAPRHNAYDLPLEVTRWLRRNGHLRDDHIPIHTGQHGNGKNFLLSFNPDDPMLSPKEVVVPGEKPVWLATGVSAGIQKTHAMSIIRRAAQAHTDFKGRWRQ